MGFGVKELQVSSQFGIINKFICSDFSLLFSGRRNLSAPAQSLLHSNRQF